MVALFLKAGADPNTTLPGGKRPHDGRAHRQGRGGESAAIRAAPTFRPREPARGQTLMWAAPKVTWKLSKR